MKRLITLILFTFSLMASASPYGTEVNSLLLKLDSMIVQQEKFVAAKERRINLLRRQMSEVRTLEETYWLNKSFYDEFCIYDADSAAAYVEKNMRIARKLQKNAWLIEWRIKKSFLLTATGLLKEASDELQGLYGSTLPPELQAEYYGQNQYLYSHMGQYLGKGDWSTNSYYRIEGLYKDSVMMTISPQDPLYLWYKGWDDLGGSDMPLTRIELEETVNHSLLDTRRDAMNAYILSQCCKEMNEPENYLKYLIYSAIADVRICNRDIASLEELGKKLFELGDIDRAYSYINYCLQNSQIYRNRVRVVSASKVQDTIHMAYQQRNKRQEDRLYMFLSLVTLLSVVLCLAVFFIYKQMKRLNHSRSELDKANSMLQRHVTELSAAHREVKEVNSRLQSLNEQLSESNDKLREVNHVKEEYIGYVFTVCSQYISKLENYRKNINRKIIAGKLDEVKTLTETSNMEQSELKEFYHNFDTVFLHIYPNFVNDFNALLRPEERITLKEGELLNTELRIYALVRLGINDSIKIAEFLHYSPQTVYNYRLRTRNKALIPKETFAETVMNLGKMETYLQQ